MSRRKKLAAKTVHERADDATLDGISQAFGEAFKGSPEGAAKLHKCAALATEYLFILCQRTPELFRGIAAAKEVWPVPYSDHKQGRQAASELFRKTLKVGSGLPIDPVGTYRPDTPAVTIAQKVVRVATAVRRARIRDWTVEDWWGMELVGRKPNNSSESDPSQLAALESWGQCGPGSTLPPFCVATVGEWKKEIGNFAKLMFGAAFVKHPDLQELRKSAVQALTTKHGDAPSDGKIGGKMISSIQQALKGIASKSKSPPI